MSKKSHAVVAEYVAGDLPEERISRGNQQKARNLSEEKAAWGRRLRRWKRKNLAALGPEGVVESLKAALAVPAHELTKEDSGLRFLRYKAIRAIGEEATTSAFNMVIGA